jgi:hypothetical protein
MPTTTTTKRPRKAPAAEVATSKADAGARGLRRFKTRRCEQCRHLIKIIRPDGSTVCEACLVRAVLYGEHNSFGCLTPAKRKPLMKEADAARKASERGPAEYRVDKQAAEAALERLELLRAEQKREDDWQSLCAAADAEEQRMADLDLGWCRELMLTDPEGVREALNVKPWNRARFDQETIERIRRVFEYREAALVPEEWLGCAAQSNIEVHHFRPKQNTSYKVETETKAAGLFEVAEEVACGREPGDAALAAAWLAVHGHRWSPEWVSSRELRELLDLVPVGRAEFDVYDEDTGRLIGWDESQWRMWDVVEPLVRERVTLAYKQRASAVAEDRPENDKVFDAEVRRYQRFMRDLKAKRDALAPGIERAALDMDISDYEKQRPQPGPGYLRRKREAERDRFMQRLALKYGDKLQPRPIAA